MNSSNEKKRDKPFLGLSRFMNLPVRNSNSILDSSSGLSVNAFPLSHSNPGKSSAFLVENTNNNYLLYLGDTGADTIEHQSNLRDLWQQVGPLITNH